MPRLFVRAVHARLSSNERTCRSTGRLKSGSCEAIGRPPSGPVVAVCSVSRARSMHGAACGPTLGAGSGTDPSVPARCELVLDIEQIEHTCQRVIDHLLEAFRALIKRGQRRKYDPAH